MSDKHRKVFSLIEAAQACHRHPQSLKWHRYRSGYFKDLGRVVGKSLVFTADEVDEMKRRFDKMPELPSRGKEKPR